MGSRKWNDSFHWIWSESFHHLTLPWDVIIPISFRSCCFTEIQLINCDWLGFKYSVGFAFFGIQKMLPGMVNGYSGLCKISQRDSKFQMMLTCTGPIFMSLSQANVPAEVLSEMTANVSLRKAHMHPWSLDRFRGFDAISSQYKWLTEVWHDHWKKIYWPDLYDVTFIRGSSFTLCNIISTALSQLTASGAVFFFFF